MKNRGAEILRLLVVDRDAALRLPWVARALILPNGFFTREQQIIARALWLNPDWRTASDWLLRSKTVPLSTIYAFRTWAEKISRRPVRGLVTWPALETNP